MKHVSAAVIIINQKVLITRRSLNQKLAGFWEFPGGKLEQNETPQQCLERELKEELGVSSTAGKILLESIYQYEHGEICLTAIKTVLHDTSFTLSVHDKFEWVKFDDLLNYKLAPADIPIAEEILKTHLAHS